MENTFNPAGTKENFAENIRNTPQASQETLAQTEEEIARQTAEFKAALAATSEAAQAALSALGEQLASGARATDRVIRDKPYHAAGVALGVGLLIGYLIKRK